MKKLLIASVLGLALVSSAQAQHHHGHRGGYGGGWVAPLLIGGIAGIVIARETSTMVVQQPIIVQPTPPNQMIQCPPGTMPFEQRGWVRNQFNQYIQATYIECR